RLPLFADAGIKTVLNGPDGYTPDGHCLMGPVPGLENFHLLAGFSIFGIVFAGGSGKYAAEWIAHGQPSDNMWELDVRRFDDYAASTEYVSARAPRSTAASTRSATPPRSCRPVARSRPARSTTSC
ncbi:MAG: FAD-dependent oxidoreductase, partial [bacterium]|nr:FAD-dependent oxidoreductase [bacterium]